MKSVIFLAVLAGMLLLLAIPVHALFRTNVDISYGIFKPKVFSGGLGISVFHRSFAPRFSGGGMFSFRLRFVDP